MRRERSADLFRCSSGVPKLFMDALGVRRWVNLSLQFENSCGLSGPFRGGHAAASGWRRNG